MEDTDAHISDAIPNNNVIVKLEVYCKMSQKITNILVWTRTDSIPDAIKIKSEGMEVCIFFFFFFFKSVLACGLDHGETHAAIGAPL